MKKNSPNINDFPNVNEDNPNIRKNAASIPNDFGYSGHTRARNGQTKTSKPKNADINEHTKTEEKTMEKIKTFCKEWKEVISVIAVIGSVAMSAIYTTSTISRDYQHINDSLSHLQKTHDEQHQAILNIGGELSNIQRSLGRVEGKLGITN